MLIIDRVTIKGTGNPVPDGTSVLIRDDTTNALLATVTTTNGFFSWQMNGSPGPIRYTCNYDGATKVHTSRSVGPAGLFQFGEMQETMTFFNGGRVRGVDLELDVTPDVTGYKVKVSPGAFMYKGLLYRQYDTTTITFVPIPPDNGAINEYGIYIQIHGTESATPGKTVVVSSNVRVGAEGPPPTGAENLMLAKVRIDPVAGSLTESDITMVAGWSDAHTHLSTDISDFASAVVAATPPLGTGEVQTINIDDAAVTTDKLADSAVVIGKIATGSITPSKLASSIYAGAGSATTVARSDHTHLAAAITDFTAAARAASPPKTDEEIQDMIADFLVAGDSISLGYNDTANSLSINSLREIVSGKFNGGGVATPMNRLNILSPLTAVANAAFDGKQLDVGFGGVKIGIGRGGAQTLASGSLTVASTTLSLDTGIPYQWFALGVSTGYGDLGASCEGTVRINSGSTRPFQFDGGVDQSVLNALSGAQTGGSLTVNLSLSRSAGQAQITSSFILAVAMPTG